MSKLSRYKKPPAVKLPLPPKKNTVKKCVLPVLDSNSEEDDDFVKAQPKTNRINVPSSSKSIGKDQQEEGDSSSQILVSRSKQIKGIENIQHGDDDNKCPPNSSTSEYFAKVHGKKGPDVSSSSDEENSPVELKTIKQSSIERPSVPEDKPKPEVVCPFCWKRLNDKLTGTIHVKACAKNLPTNQIFEALQLQEKQIKEWEQLGIAYPGYQGEKKGTSAGGNGRRGGGRAGNRSKAPPRSGVKKKQDPELELAIALSESLHEEVDRRRETENEFIISNDLQREIELLPPTKLPVDRKPAPVFVAPTKIVKRGRKVNLTELPLYKASEPDKKLEIERRLNFILDEHEKKGWKQDGEFYIRDNPLITSLRLPHRLRDCLNATSTRLWCMSSSEISTRDAPETFVTRCVSECKLNEDTMKSASIEGPPKTFESPDADSVKGLASRTAEANETPRTSKSSSKKKTEELMKVAIDDDSTSTQQQLIKDLLQMFVHTEGADVTVYGREEKPIKCHKFILLARSRKLYSEIVQETSRKGNVRNIIALTCFSHLAVKAFIKFLYCGKLKELRGQDLEDALELGSRYGIAIKPQQSNTAAPNHSVNPIEPSGKAMAMESCKQLDVPSCSSPTAEVELKGDHLKESTDRNHSHSRRSSSEDMFADEFEKYEADDFEFEDISEQKETTLVNNCPSNPQHINNDDGSRDMFEDLDDENSKENNLEYNEEIEETPVIETQFEDENCKISLEDELMTQADSQCRRLFSPKPASQTTRRSHPDAFFPSSQSSLTASQVAVYIDYMGTPDDSGKSQANKKHKLQADKCSIPGSVDCNNDDSLEILEGDDVVRKFKKLRKDFESFSSTPLSANSRLPYHQSKAIPSRCPYNPCLSPVQRMEIDADCDMDPFEDPFGTDGDSCFLNLPSVIFQSSPLVQNNPVAFNKSPPDNPYFSRSSSSSPLSSRNRNHTQEQEFGETQTKRNKQGGASKLGKGGRSKKQGKRASSQEPTPTRNIGNSQKNTNSYHAMDYSTIDTPILKKELKRYGLKPLPRSKAKLILRHIDEEISKK